MPDDVYNAGKGQINVGGPLYDYAAKGNKIELFGKRRQRLEDQIDVEGEC